MDKRRHHIIQFVCLMAVFVAVTLQSIIEKDAKEKGIPLEEHIRQNALYVLQVQQQNENL